MVEFFDPEKTITFKHKGNSLMCLNKFRLYHGETITNNQMSVTEMTWDEFFMLKNFNSPERINITKDDYLKLPKNQRIKHKDGKYFIAGVLSEPIRKSSNLVSINFLCLDIENQPPKQDLLFYKRALDKLDYSYLIHTTLSHTEENPRLRLIIPTSNIPVSDYPQAIHTVAEKINLKSINPESLRPIQPMFFPKIFLDDHNECDFSVKNI